MFRESAIVWYAALSVLCPSALAQELPDVMRFGSDEVEISNAQKAELTELEDKFYPALEALTQNREGIEAAIARMREAHDAMKLALLTPEQKEELKTLRRVRIQFESQAQVKSDVQHLDQLLPVLKKLQRVRSVSMLEGPRRMARDAADVLPKDAAVVRVDKYVFFEEPLDLNKDDELSVLSTASNYRSYSTYRGGKFCGGFHPDASIRLATDDGMVELLVCFGCHEVRIISGETDMMVDLGEEAYQSLDEVCKRVFRHRGAGPVSKTRKAEPGVGADSR